MKLFELKYVCAEPFLPPLMKLVRRRLRVLARSFTKTPEILDVGGRKSHYTIGVRANVTVSDLPRESELQTQLNLGVTETMIEQTMRRRTNVRQVLFDDMTNSKLPDSSFDFVVAVEVLEHVERDAAFVSEVARILRPGGIFLMTTPNGDFVENRNPDHKRHYLRRQLDELLRESFDDVVVDYAIRGGRFRRWGLKAWSPRRPHQTLMSIFGNVVNSIESSSEGVKRQSHGTHHLVATAWNPRPARVSQRPRAIAFVPAV